MQVKELKDKHAYKLSKEQKNDEKKQKVKGEKDERIQNFYENTVGQSNDLND